MADAILTLLYQWFCFILLFSILKCTSVEAGPLPIPPPLKGRPLSSIVDLGYSKYQGTVLDAGVNQYLGMRYAAPPLGNRRWRAPEDPPNQYGVQDATQVC